MDYTNETELMALTAKRLQELGKELGVKGLWGCRKAALAHWIAHEMKRRSQ